MPLIRNPFRKAAQSTLPSNKSTDSFHSTATTPENPPLEGTASLNDSSNHVNVSAPYNVPSARAISIHGKVLEEEQLGAYKLSVVNDSGVFIPPSPPERASFFWRRKENKESRTSDRSSLEEPFTISRESFESYRRSFDISARSPVTTPTRQSLDSQTLPHRVSLDSRLSRLDRPAEIVEVNNTDDDEFEEVKLNEQSTKPKKRGIFSKFGTESGSAEGQCAGGGSAFKFTIKKEVTSGPQGNELARFVPRARPVDEVVLN